MTVEGSTVCNVRVNLKLEMGRQGIGLCYANHLNTHRTFVPRVRIVGLNEVSIQEAWKTVAEGYLGTAVNGYERQKGRGNILAKTNITYAIGSLITTQFLVPIHQSDKHLYFQ